VALHFGAAAGQSAFVKHPTQVFVAVLHFGAVAGQLASARHATQDLVTVLHLGVLAGQSVSTLQTQLCATVSHFGVVGVAEHWLSAVQTTQALAVVLQCGVAGVLTHCASVRHPGTHVCVAASHSGADVPQSVSARQMTQAFFVVSQRAFGAEQFASLMQPARQLLVVASQTGVVAGQATVAVALRAGGEPAHFL